MKNSLLVCLLLLSLAACNSDGDSKAMSENANNTTSNELQRFSSIAGVYTYPDFGNGEEGYLVIGNDGAYAEYDYIDGDTGQCYSIKNDDIQLQPNQEGRFSINRSNGVETEQLLVTEDALKVFFVFDGIVSDYFFIYTRANEVSLDDLTPLC